MARSSRFGVRFAFASGSIALVSLVIFLATELFIMRSQLDREINGLREDYDSKYAQAKTGLEDEMMRMKDRLNTELSDVRKQLRAEEKMLDRHHVMIKELTTTVDDRLNTTVHLLNVTVKQAQIEVRDQVFDLTQDVGTYVNNTEDHFDSQSSLMAFQSAGTFTVIGGLVTVWQMTSHLRHYHEPIVQRKIMAILWMCPIYGITSWFSLILPALEGYMAVLKDFYEAYCIYIFLSFLIAVLGRGDRAVVVEQLAKRSEHMSPPISCYGLCFGRTQKYESARAKADSILLQCQTSAVQFTLVRPVTSVLFLIFNGVYGKQSIWNPLYPQFYFNMIVNVSIFVAFSGLLKFYHAVHDELAWCRPFPKFMCIKGVVFMTFWQGLALSVYANTSAAFANTDDAIEWRYRTQNYLICVEMFFFSVAHYFVFSPEEWEEGYKPKEKVKQKFGDQMALRDFVHDIKLIARSRSKGKKKKKEGSKEPPPATTDSDRENKNGSSPLEYSGAAESDDYVDALLGLEDNDDMEFISNIIQEAESLKLEEEVVPQEDTYKEII